MAEERIGITIESVLKRLEETLAGLKKIAKGQEEVAKATDKQSVAAKKAAQAEVIWEKARQRGLRAQEAYRKALIASGKTTEQADEAVKDINDSYSMLIGTTDDIRVLTAAFETELAKIKIEQEQVAWTAGLMDRAWKSAVRRILTLSLAIIPMRALWAVMDALTDVLMAGSKAQEEYAQKQLEVSENMDAYVQRTIDAQMQAGTFTKVIMGLKLSGDALTKTWAWQDLAIAALTGDYDDLTLRLMTARAESEFLKARTEELARVGFALASEKLKEQRQELLATSASSREYIDRIIELTFGSREAYEAATWLNKALFEQGLALEYVMGRTAALTALMAPQREASQRLSALYVERIQLHEEMADRAAQAGERQAQAEQRLADQIERAWSRLYEVTLPRMLEDHGIRMAKITDDLAVRLAGIWARMETSLAKQRSSFNHWMEDQEWRHQENLRRIRERYDEDRLKLDKSLAAKRKWIEVFGRQDLLDDLKKWYQDELAVITEEEAEETAEEQREWAHRKQLREEEHRERMAEIRAQAETTARLAEEAAARAAAREEEQYELRKKRAEEDAKRREKEMKASLRAVQDVVDTSFAKALTLLETKIKREKGMHAAAVKEYERIMRTGGRKAGLTYAEKFGREMEKLQGTALDPTERKIKEFGEDQVESMWHYGWAAAEAWGARFHQWFQTIWVAPIIERPGGGGGGGGGGAFQAGLRYVPGTMDVTVHAAEAILHAREAQAYRAMTSALGPLSRLTTASASRYYYEGGTQIGPISVQSEMDLMKLLGVVDRKLGSRARRRMRFGG